MAEIGSILRETRMRARIDISEVEAHTKIRAKYLRAIENEDWDLLPGPVFVKSFLRTYGDYLGIDSRPLVDEFKRRYEDPGEYEARPVSARSREREQAAGGQRWLRVPPAALIGVVLLVVVGALYVIGNGSNGNKTPVGRAPTSAGSTHRHHHHPRGRGHHGGGRTTPTKTATTPPAPTVATLSLAQVRAPLWVCVVDPSGKPLINGVIYQPGATIPTVKGAELLVNLGNDNVAVKINGKPYTLPSPAAIGLRITPTHVSSLAPGPTCG